MSATLNATSTVINLEKLSGDSFGWDAYGINEGRGPEPALLSHQPIEAYGSVMNFQRVLRRDQREKHLGGFKSVFAPPEHILYDTVRQRGIYERHGKWSLQPWLDYNCNFSKISVISLQNIWMKALTDSSNCQPLSILYYQMDALTYLAVRPKKLALSDSQ